MYPRSFECRKSQTGIRLTVFGVDLALMLGSTALRCTTGEGSSLPAILSRTALRWTALALRRSIRQLTAISFGKATDTSITLKPTVGYSVTDFLAMSR